MRRNVVPVKKFQILFTTIRHLTSWAEGLARYEIRWEDSNAVVMVSPFDHYIQSNFLYSIIVHRRHYTGLRGYRDKLVSEEQRTQFDGFSNQEFNSSSKVIYYFVQ
jgi:hypothetical protein